MDIAVALTSLGAALNIVKQVKDIDQAFDRASYRGQMLDLMEKLQDMREVLLDAREEINKKNDQIIELRSTLEKHFVLLDLGKGYRYIDSGDGKPTGYPVCPGCEQTTGKIVQLVRDGTVIQAKCPVCSTKFSNVDAYQAPPRTSQKTMESDELERQAEGMERMSQQLARLGRNLG